MDRFSTKLQDTYLPTFLSSYLMTMNIDTFTQEQPASEVLILLHCEMQKVGTWSALVQGGMEPVGTRSKLDSTCYISVF